MRSSIRSTEHVKADAVEEGRPVAPLSSVEKEKARPPSLAQQGLAALFYAVSSLLVIFVNKAVLTSYHFPSFNFVALSQFVTTVIVMWAMMITGKTKVRSQRCELQALSHSCWCVLRDVGELNTHVAVTHYSQHARDNRLLTVYALTDSPFELGDSKGSAAADRLVSAECAEWPGGHAAHQSANVYCAAALHYTDDHAAREVLGHEQAL
jgi:hypothetical protein